jgi:hypothetical protein
MAMNYMVVVSETQPENRQPGTFWFINSVGLFLLYVGNGVYNQLAARQGAGSIADGIYYRETIDSATPPVSPSMCDIWIDDLGSAWVYLGSWVPYGGG